MDILVRNLRHIFPGKPPRMAVDDMSFAVPDGQFTAVVGPSGCGKSTLLRLAANLLHASSGEILLGGQTPAQAVAKKQIVWMAQSPALLPWLTARENIALAARMLPASMNGHRSGRLSTEQALERVGLADFADAYPFTLSGGMQQRVALARALTLPAGLWLMDEPFAALDELTRERLAGELVSLWQQVGPTVLWVTHNLSESLRLADRVLVLSPRPACLVADLRVDLPRPRDETSPAFIDLLRRLRQTLTLEAV